MKTELCSVFSYGVFTKQCRKEYSVPQRIMGKMPSGKGGEGGAEQEIFEGFLDKATQTIVYILARSIREKVPQRIFRTTAYYG